MVAAAANPHGAALATQAEVVNATATAPSRAPAEARTRIGQLASWCSRRSQAEAKLAGAALWLARCAVSGSTPRAVSTRKEIRFPEPVVRFTAPATTPTQAAAHSTQPHDGMDDAPFNTLP